MTNPQPHKQQTSTDFTCATFARLAVNGHNVGRVLGQVRIRISAEELHHLDGTGIVVVEGEYLDSEVGMQRNVQTCYVV